MKCDELQYERLGDANKTYPASTLVIRKQFDDAAIAELKDENRMLKRALWLAREARATWQKILRDAWIFFAIGKCKEWDFYNTKQKKWQRVETKCAAKAKEFV